jgi:stage III sporulation protein AE
MKGRSIKALSLVLLLLAALLLCPLEASAAEIPDADSIWEQLRNAMPDLVADRLPDSPDADAVLSLVGLRGLLSALLSGVGEGLASVLPFLSSLLGFTLLWAVAELLRSDTKSEGIRRLMGAALSATFATLIWERAKGGVSATVTLLRELSETVGGAIPVLTSVKIASGEGLGAAVGGSALSFGVAVVESVAASVLPCVAGCSFGFALIGSLGGELKLDGISKSLRGLYLTVLGLLSFLLTTSLAMQKTLVSSADTAAVRSAKYAVGTMIPIVGSTISSLVGTVGASMSVLKSTVGVGILAAILLLALPPLVYLLLARFSFSIAGAVAHLLGLARLEGLFSEFRGVYDMMLAVGAISTCMFLISLSLLLGGAGVAA